jgi:hypothetical protein
LPKETHLSGKDKHKLKLTGWKKIVQSYETQEQAGIAIFVSDKRILPSNQN